MALTRWFAAICISLTVVLTDPMARAQPAGIRAELTRCSSSQPTANIAQITQGLATPSSPLRFPDLSRPSDSRLPPGGDQQTEEEAQEQLDQQLHQRVFGVMATFNTTNNRDALPLSTGQKYQLFFKSASDPWPFVLTAFGAGIDQAENSFPEYGQGVEGYAKRWGAGYTDYFTGNLLGNAVLASLFREDPRYFQEKAQASYRS